MEKEYVLITGASSGIGAALAHEYAKNGHCLILIARNIDRLEHTKKHIRNSYKVEVITHSCDCSKTDNIDKLIEWITGNGYNINTLINNAGIGYWGHFIDEDYNQIKTMLNLNVVGLTYLARRILEIMKKGATILNVSSVAAMMPPIPMVAAYAASKKYVLNFSKALNYELKNQGILVSVLCPPDVESGFQKTAGASNYKPKGVSAQKVAQVTYAKLHKRKKVIKPWSLVDIIMNVNLNLFPRGLFNKITSRMIEERIKK